VDAQGASRELQDFYVRRVAVRGATPTRLVAAVRETAKLQAGVA
jgi:hypothetical protein